MSSFEAPVKAGGISAAPRERFGSRLEGVLYCAGLAVGIGSVWRFPYLVYQNGGGSFVLAYVILMIVIGFPLYTMEIALGQFSAQGPGGIWKCLPAAKGIGYAQVVISLSVAVYYNVLLAYTLYYLTQSFRSELPWAGCYDWWGADKELCFVRQKNMTLCRNIASLLPDDNVDIVALLGNCSNATMSAAEMFWERHVLELSSGISEVGGLKWDLVAYLLVSWIIVFLCVVRGVSSSGKVVYFTATFPFVVISILLVKGLTLDGAMQGVQYFLLPNFESLKSPALWRLAAEQLFYTLAVGFGGLIMSGSYQNFRTTIMKDSFVVILFVFLASFLGGIAIFSVLGYMSKTYGIPIDEVAKQGQGLAFVVYPEALTTFWWPQLWSAIFFLMLYLLGIDSEFPLVQTALTVLSDDFPSLRRHRALTALALCTICFLLGLTCVTRGGQYVLNLMDTYCAGVPVLIAAFVEIAAVMWIYGVNNFSNDLEFMLGKKPNALVRLSWVLVSPALLALLVGYYFYNWTPIVYNNQEPYPRWADYLGMGLAAFSVIQIPLVAILVILRKKSFRKALQADESWGPAEGHVAEEYKRFKEDWMILQTRAESFLEA